MEPPLSSESRCRFCGSAVPADAPRGFCPSCLFKVFGSEADRSRQGQSGSKSDPDSAPDSASATFYSFGDYEVHGEIDSGGMGVVYLARQISLNRPVALKMIRSGTLATAKEIQLFKREANAAAALEHPNIVPIYEVGEIDGRHYFSMKLIEGGNLAERLPEFGIPDPNSTAMLSDTELEFRTRKLARLVACLARTVHHAHQRGVLHRDLKPTNILIDEAGEPHLTDFGLAKVAEGPDIMHSLAIIGTPAYMAPEQALGPNHQLTTAADIYSLGAILYQLLAGRPPFQGESAAEILSQVKERSPAPLRQINPRLDRDVVTIAAKCLENKPEGRYATALELAEDLERWLHGEAILARPLGRGEKLIRWCRREPALAGVLGLLALALIGGVAGVISQWRRAESHARNESAQRQLAQEAVFRLTFEKAETFFEQDRAAIGLAHFGRLLRQYPTNPVVAARIQSALGWRPFCLPLAPVAHTRRIVALRLSSDGERLLSASSDGILRALDLRHGTRVVEFRNPQPLSAAMFTPDGSRVFTASYAGVAQLWDISSASPSGAAMKHSAPIDAIDISPSGLRLATGSRDQTARVWDGSTGHPITPVLKTGGVVKSVRFSPDARRLITVCEGNDARRWDIQVWNAISGEKEGAVITNQPGLAAAQFTPDGAQLLVANAAFFDAATGKFLRTVPQPSERTVLSGKFAPDGTTLLTSSQDGTARLWDWRTLQPLSMPMHHDSAVIDAAFGARGQELMTGSRDGTARIWDLQGRPLSEPMRTGQSVWTALLSDSGTRAVMGPHGEEAWIWEVRHRREAPTFDHSLGLLWAAFNPDATRLVTTSQDRTAKIWDTESGSLVGSSLVHSGWVNHAEFSADGRYLVTAAQDGLARLWDLSNRRVIRTFVHRDHVRTAEISPDGKYLVTASFDNTAQVWDLFSGEKIGKSLENTGRVHAAHFSRDGRKVVTAAQPGVVRVWSAFTGEPLTPEMRVPAITLNARFAPDAERVVSVSLDRTARVWDATTGKQILPPVEHSDELAPFSPDISRDGRCVLTAAGNTARIWDIFSGRPLIDGFAHDGIVRSARFSPDGTRVVTASADHTARIWDAATGLPISEPLRHDQPVVNGFFTPDGRQALTISEDGTAKLWEVPGSTVAAPDWLAELAEAVGGLRFNNQGMLETVSTQAFPALRERLQRLGGSDDWSTWARWFCNETNRSSRSQLR